MVKWTGKKIVQLTLYKEITTFKLGAVSYEHFLFLLGYLLAAYWCLQTIGEQHYEALEAAEKRNIDVYDESERLRKSAENYFLNSDTPSSTTPSSSAPVFIPSKWLPGFWPSVCLALVAIFHALMILGQRWSVTFRCLIKFRKTTGISEATHIHVTPNRHFGKEELVPLLRNPAPSTSLSFEYRRRKYVYDAKTDTFIKVRCKVNYPLSHYISWAGVTSSMLKSLTELYGPNKFQISSPQFMDLYVAQLTSPFTVFQLFCTLLWCLDDYWRYSLFTLFMICSFEATTVWTRLKSLNTLKGMGNEPRPIKVFRGSWTEISTEELVPGDLFSLVRTPNSDDIIPCDALLLQGSAVVNEATLTGESVPQMKDALVTSTMAQQGQDIDDLVNIKGEHKVHALFGGTRVLQVTSVADKNSELREQEKDEHEVNAHPSPSEDGEGEGVAESKGVDEDDLGVDADEEGLYNDGVPAPPDGGCLCYCTRTGFGSSQGKLVRMIENSTAAVAGDTRDTALLLLLLLVFAVSASGYVLYKGMQDGTRSRYQLLLHCILIVTSVIPPELPMQTALAVNNSLMTLMKLQIFCTEPFRVPVAGKLDVCVFDKTGTITTDELVAVGIVSSTTRIETLRKEYAESLKKMEELNAKRREEKPVVNNNAPKQAGAAAPPPQPVLSVSVASAGLTKMTAANAEITLVLGACHSLVLIDGSVAGDPLEVASVKAVKWELAPLLKDTVRPKPKVLVERPLKLTTAGSREEIPLNQVTIIARHHFNSKLQRMSTVVKITSALGDHAPAFYVLAKGSPEIIATLCSDVPSDYQAIASDLAKRGMRVIALAMKRIHGDSQVCCDSRVAAESHLTFVGFASFTCRVRKDSPMIIQILKEGGNRVIMATGDAMLTAVHVAKEVGILTSTKKDILLLEAKEGTTGEFYWKEYESDRIHSSLDISQIPKLSKDYDLGTTGFVLEALLSGSQAAAIKPFLDHFVVYARMRPDEKERVIQIAKDHGRVCLMCGDGANDVGALKAADVGVALLSGFGDLNVDKGDNNASAVPADGKSKDAVAKASTAAAANVTAIMTKEDYDELKASKISDIKNKLRLLGVEPNDYPQVVEKNDLIDLYRRSAAKKATENSELKRNQLLSKMTPQERNKFLAEERQKLIQQKQEEFKKVYEELTAKGESWAMVKAMQKVWTEDAKKKSKDNTFTGSAGKMAAMMESMNTNMEGLEELEVPMVKIGDASVAAPFTSKMPSIKGALDIIRQGRCTLITTIQMYQVLALNCLINAYSLSVLHLDGVKYGDRQMTCLGILMSISFVTISRSKPLEKLSAVKPWQSIFHPSLFLSLIGQFIIHLFTMHYLVSQGKQFLPPDHKVDLDKEFKPNAVNSIVFLVTAVQQVSVFVVNLKGHPFMTGLTENTPLLWSLAFTLVGSFVLASEYIPQLNTVLQLEAFPSTAFRNTVLLFLIIDVSVAFLWDRLMLAIFAFPILKASMAATTTKDMMAVARVVAIVAFLVSYLANVDFDALMAAMEEMENAENNSTLATAASESSSAAIASL